MFKRTAADARWSVLICLFVLALITAAIVIPERFGAEASGGNSKGLVAQTSVQDEGIPKMWDIREADGDQFVDALASFRASVNKDASTIADIRDGFAASELELQKRQPGVRIEYNTDIRIPEVITPDVSVRNFTWLTEPSAARRSTILRGFMHENKGLLGMTDSQVDGLKVTAEYTNPDGNLSYVHLEQLINNVPVFRGEIKAGFTKKGELVRVINNLAPALNYTELSSSFGDPSAAVAKAAAHINHELTEGDRSFDPAASTDLKAIFGKGDWATTAEKMYFPTEPGVAVPAWRVLIWQPVNAYYVIVDAQSGVVLWHKNISDDQTQPATYQVYANPGSIINAADHAAPLSPGPIDPNLGTQGSLLTRSNVTLVGNEGGLSFNNNGWITDGINITDGNANEAGIDRDGVNGVDPASRPVGSPNRVFDSTWNPPPGNPAPGDDPLTAQAQRGAVIQMFYVMNRYHDILYQHGFTEAARNFQQVNFTGQGVGNDRVSSEGQDSSGTNNANFDTPADGARGRMQMYLWNGPTPDRDGTADGDILIHEVTHGTSNRIHGNGSGLGNQGGMMGEGWGDFYAHTLLSEPTDPINSILGLGGYSLFNAGGTMTSNHYYGIRRFPTAVIGFTGGPARPACNNGPCPHNPLTFKHINSDCNTTIGTSTMAVTSAFPRNGFFGSNTCSQVHAAGEIWKSALWEVRALMVTRLGFALGTDRVLQVVTDGMKLAPISPTFLQERDAIIAAAAALASPQAAADVMDVREGFRRRGMGFSASVQSNTAVTEAFDVPNAVIAPTFSVSDSTGDGDGFPEPNENVLLNVTITNNSGGPVTNVVGSVTGGGSANFGDLANGESATRPITYTVPAAVACGSIHSVTITGTSTAGPINPQNRSFRVGTPAAPTALFENNTPVTVTAAGPNASVPYGTTIDAAGLSGNKIIKLGLNDLTHTNPSNLDMLLVGPGGQKFMAMSDRGGTTDVNAIDLVLTDTAAAVLPTTLVSGSHRPSNTDTTTDVMPAPAPAAPYSNPATAGSATFASTFLTDGAAMNGTWTLYVRDDLNLDAGSLGGWSLSFESADFVCDIGGGTPTPTATATSTPTATATATATPTATPCAVGSTTVVYTGPSVAVPDSLPAGVNINLPISGVGTISDLNFRINSATHSWVGDLVFRLTAPNGTTSVIAVDQPGVPASTFGCSSDNYINTVLDDEGSSPIENACSDGMTGTFTPNNPLSAFDGLSANGTWVLNVSDRAAGDTGTLNAFALVFTGTGGCGTPTATPTGTPVGTATPTATPTATATATGTPTGSPTPCSVTLAESFETAIPAAPQGPPGTAIVLPSGTWHAYNASAPIGTTGVFTSTLLNPSPDGAQHLAMNFNNGSGVAAIDTYMMSPVVTLNNGDALRFFTRTVSAPVFADRLRVVMSTNGASTNPADFTTVLLTVNPGLTPTGYPNTWTQFTAHVIGLSGATSGRFAFNYNVPNGGPNGTNSDFIGIDQVQFGGPCGTPTATPTAVPSSSPTATPTSTPTATPTATPTSSPTPTPCNGSVVSYTGPPVPIVDADPVGVNINVPVSGVGTISDINVRFDGTGFGENAGVSHTWIGDLKFTLTAPNGTTTVAFFDQPGVPGSTFGCSSDDLWNSTMDDEATIPLEKSCSDGMTGVFVPNNALSAFDGLNANGTWVLNVSDLAAGDEGLVRAFSLVFTGTGGCGTPTATPTGTPGLTSVHFSNTTFTEDESQTFTTNLVRTGVTTGSSTVTFATSNGTAIGGAACTAGVDYISVNQSVVFAPGVTSMPVSVVLCGDGVNETTFETVNLTITGPDAGPPSTATLRINDTANAYRNTTPIGIEIRPAGAPESDVPDTVPYPSTITVTNGPTQIGALRVTFYDMWHVFPDNMDALLVGPGGQKFVLMGDAGGGNAIDPLTPVTITFQDVAPAVLPDSAPLTTGKFEPTTWESPVTSFPAPAPPAPYNEPGSAIGGSGPQTLTGTFGQTNANGVWSLYVRDDAGQLVAITGEIGGGWGLEFIAPTAAQASISGRVLTAEGLGIRNAEMVLTGNSLAEPLRVTTSSFGYFQFEGLQTGETYIVTVNSRRYTFQTPSQVISLVDNAVDVDFTAVPIGAP